MTMPVNNVCTPEITNPGRIIILSQSIDPQLTFIMQYKILLFFISSFDNPYFYGISPGHKDVSDPLISSTESHISSGTLPFCNQGILVAEALVMGVPGWHVEVIQCHIDALSRLEADHPRAHNIPNVLLLCYYVANETR